MKELKKEFSRGKKNIAVKYKQLHRSDISALYECTDIDGDIYYEVFKIKRSPASSYAIDGIEVSHEAKERYPTDNDFGSTAWCTRNLVEGKEIYLSIESHKIKI